MKRREFFTKSMPSYLLSLGKIFVEEADISKEKKDYFENFESCYPYLSEVSYEMLADAAKQLGIEVSNKDKLTLAKEVFAKEGRMPHE
ncbi:MAG: hypothetical protein PHQ45_05565 [Acidaminococcaceae bacterium]|nr:hypothetical protein [Acidaminococcaceae bacterium]